MNTPRLLTSRQDELERQIEEALDCNCVADLKQSTCGPAFVAAFACFARAQADDEDAPPAGCMSSFVALQVRPGSARPPSPPSCRPLPRCGRWWRGLRFLSLPPPLPFSSLPPSLPRTLWCWAPPQDCLSAPPLLCLQALERPSSPLPPPPAGAHRRCVPPPSLFVPQDCMNARPAEFAHLLAPGKDEPGLEAAAANSSINAATHKVS